MYICFQVVDFVREHTWHKVLLMGDSVRFDLTLVSRVNSSLIEYRINKALCHIRSLTKATTWKHTYM